MKKKNIILFVKILSVVFWLVTLFIPKSYKLIENTEFVKLTRNDKTNQFEVEFAKPIKNGNLTISFYDKDDEFFGDYTHFFEKNDSCVVDFVMNDYDFSEVVKVEFDNANVNSVDFEMLKKIMYPTSIFCLILMLTMFRIRFKSVIEDGKLIEVYAGVFKHTIKVDGNVIFADKFLFKKDAKFSVELSDKKLMNVAFKLSNNIEINFTGETE